MKDMRWRDGLERLVRRLVDARERTLLYPMSTTAAAARPIRAAV